MKAVIQRVSEGSVTVDEKVVAEIGQGLVILLGIAPDDTVDLARQMVSKIANLRIFEDENEKMNLSALDVAAEAIVISQFTLYADTSFPIHAICRHEPRPAAFIYRRGHARDR